MENCRGDGMFFGRLFQSGVLATLRGRRCLEKPYCEDATLAVY